MTNILQDSGERIIPPQEGEVSVVFEHHKFTYDVTSKHIFNKDVLDVGCGTGYGAAILANHARTVTGIDYHIPALEYCKNIYSANNIAYSGMEAVSLAFKDDCFDIATSFQVIEHISDVRKFLKELKRVVKPGGLIFISTPNVSDKAKKSSNNSFHVNEMSYYDLNELLTSEFNSFKIEGQTYSSGGVLKTMIRKLPLYNWGAMLKRNSKFKKYVSQILGLTSYTSTIKGAATSMDLYAICNNN